MPQPLDVSRLEAAEVLPPGVDRLRADTTPFRDLRHRPLIDLAQDRDHLLFAESRLLHALSWIEGAILSGFSCPKTPSRSYSSTRKFRVFEHRFDNQARRCLDLP